MLSVKGIFQDGVAKPVEAVPRGRNGWVVITFLDDFGDVNTLRTGEDYILAREEDAFIKMHSILCQNYLNQYVAIHGSEMVDHDADLELLTLRMYERFSDQPVWIAPVRQQPVEEWHMRSPRLDRSVS